MPTVFCRICCLLVLITFNSGSYAASAHEQNQLGTRNWQPHVYLPLTPAKRDGYWPPGPIVENDASTHKWQLLSPQIQPTCAIFPSNPVQSADGGYAWSLWRP